ncbi:FAD-binding and (Fe-S)-binding domain-containing protein [Jatrophihabitans sp. DSM 45814]
MTPDDLAAALRFAGVAEVDVSTRRRAEYSTDASNYRVVPNAVVFPRHADEVALALEVARATGTPFTARGAGTSCAGNAVGPGIVLDFSRHLNKIIAIDPESRRATVQPGVILADLQRAAGQHGLRFGPDPSTQARCTIGGMIGNNACGAHALAYGKTAHNVAALSLLLPDGRAMRATTLGDSIDPEAAALSRLVGDNLALIRTEFGRFSRQTSGYSLEHLLPENGANLARFFGGTEGTLATITEAEVVLVQAAPFTALAVLAYPDMATAADAVPALLPLKPLALEGMDSRLIQVLIDRRGPSAAPPLPRGGGWLFVETGGQTQAEAVAAAEEFARAAALDGSTDSTVVIGEDARRLWRIREDGAGLGGRTPANAPAWPGWEDAAVPPEHIGKYLREFTTLLAEHHLDGLIYGHLGDGCVHVRLDFPLADRPKSFREFMFAAAELVASYGGSMSGEHGDGRARSELLPLMYSAEAIRLFSSVKAIFDPANLLNPGVLVDPAPVDADLRLPQAVPLTGPLGFSYPHDGGSFTTAVHRCVGVGKCRADTTATGGVMCPSYLATKDETHSTRGRARVLQEMANGSLVTEGWKSPEVTEALDLCLSCKGCSSDCPAGVDMATYKAEALFHRYRRRLRPASHYLLGWLPRWAKLATRTNATARMANASLKPKPLASLAKQVGGIDPRRPLPQFARESFRRWFANHPVTTGDPVMLWLDTFTNGFSPEVGIAAVQVLEAAGFSVRIPERQVCCGLTWISTGQLDGARKQLRASLDALEPALNSGIPIVGLEPSCTAVFRSDAVELLPDDPRAIKAKQAIRTLAELLTERGWVPPDLAGVTALAQPHCHQHAVMGFGADRALLTDAGAEVSTVGGCCGLAGNFGVEKGHYEVSVAVAEHDLLPAVRAANRETVILADGFSCRTQLDQLADRSGQHLAELLAERLTTDTAKRNTQVLS